MYDPQLALAAIDANKYPILALCGLAMVFNYIWFFAAGRQGLRDRAYPIPIVTTLFWLAGDSSMVYRWHLWFGFYHHWYLELFCVALCFTVAFELWFLSMILRFGRAELAPRWSQGGFRTMILLAAVATFIAWEYAKSRIDDPIYINYFHLANLVGPIFAAALSVRRRSRAGTNTTVWAAYTAMVTCWFTASALWFGFPFGSVPYLSAYAICIAASAAMIVVVSRLPAPVSPSRGFVPTSRGHPA